jgi:hypothetical protein
MIEHGHGLMLAPFASNTRWTMDALAAATAVTSLAHIKFGGPVETRHISYGVLLFAFGERARRAAARLPLTFTPIGVHMSDTPGQPQPDTPEEPAGPVDPDTDDGDGDGDNET